MITTTTRPAIAQLTVAVPGIPGLRVDWDAKPEHDFTPIKERTMKFIVEATFADTDSDPVAVIVSANDQDAAEGAAHAWFAEDTDNPVSFVAVVREADASDTGRYIEL